VLLNRLYVGEAIFQGQCQAADITLDALEEPPPSNKTAALCTIIKDLAILLAIPQSPGPLPTEPATEAAPQLPSLPPSSAVPLAVPLTCKDVKSTGKEADMGETSNSTSQSSHAGATETSSPPPASAATAAAIITRAVSSGVDTESVAYLCLPQFNPFTSTELLAPEPKTTAAIANNSNNNNNDTDKNDTVNNNPEGIEAAVQAIQTAEQFLQYHEKLFQALKKPSTVLTGTGNGIANHGNNSGISSKLITLHSNLSNLYSLYCHTAQLKPEVSVHAAHIKLPQNTELAVEIASKLVHEFSSEELADMRKVSRAYEREMNKISVSVEGWMDRIRSCVVSEQPVPFSVAASVSLDLVKCVSHLNAAIADGIKARSEMLENLKSSINLHHIEYINSCSYPYMPDYVAVYTLLQEIAQEMYRSNNNNS
jgi:hypothetical protein